VAPRCSNADGSFYDAHADEARAIIKGAGGGGATASDPDAYIERKAFIQRRHESTYSFVRRLMDEVRWRVFVREGVVVIASEPALARAVPALVLGDELLEQDDFEQHRALRAGEASLQAYVGAYDADPGETVIVDTLPQLDDVNWLIASSRVDLLDDVPLVDIAVRLPQAPSMEPSSTVKTRDNQEDGGSGASGGSGSVVASGTPKNVIDRLVLPVARKHGINVTVASVTAANATHGSTKGGSRSDHEGPPSEAWAVDAGIGPDIRGGGNRAGAIKGDALAKELAGMFDIPWTGAGIRENTAHGYRYQLIWRFDSAQAGNQFHHVLFGVKRA